MEKSRTPQRAAFSLPRTAFERSARFALAAALIWAIGCGRPAPHPAAPHASIEPFNFQIESGAERYQIEGYI
ncbi:MAG TPA: hypothetical protein VJ718_07305, partial [Candidatus Binataceae bacterium]|nr:hypothetical protein [Candidatus Binataceae bacterium]